MLNGSGKLIDQLGEAVVSSPFVLKTINHNILSNETKSQNARGLSKPSQKTNS